MTTSLVNSDKITLILGVKKPLQEMKAGAFLLLLDYHIRDDLIPELLVNTEFFAPTWVKFVSITREGFERTCKFLVLLGVLDRIGT